jgi:hypothetical protein
MRPNDRCSCGSGLKYKRCCWRTELAAVKRQQEETARKRAEDRATGKVPDGLLTYGLFQVLSGWLR